MHVTLVFLGDAVTRFGDAASRLEALVDAIDRVCAQIPAFRLELGGAGGFPPRGKVRVLWLGAKGGETLLTLQRSLETAVCETLGLDPEKRAFHPHVTMARAKPPWPRSALGRFVDIVDAGLERPVGFEVDRVTLFESRLRPSGAEYNICTQHSLAVPVEATA